MGGGKLLVASLIIAEAENISAHMGRARPIEKIERALFLLVKGKSLLLVPNLCARGMSRGLVFFLLELGTCAVEVEVGAQGALHGRQRWHFDGSSWY